MLLYVKVMYASLKDPKQVGRTRQARSGYGLCPCC